MTVLIAVALLAVVGAVNLRYEPTIAERMAAFKASEGGEADGEAGPQARVVNDDGSAAQKKACKGRAAASKGSEMWCKCNIDKAVIGADGVTGPTRCVDVGGGRADVCKWDAAAKVCVPSAKTSTTTTVPIPTLFTTSPAPVPDGRGNANAKKCALCAYWGVLSTKCEANKGEGGTPISDRPRPCPCKGDVSPTAVGTTSNTSTTTRTRTGTTTGTKTSTNTTKTIASTGTTPPSTPTKSKM